MTTIFLVEATTNECSLNGKMETITIPVAWFSNRSEAEKLAKAENDEVQAEQCKVTEIACVDDYGFPCTPEEKGFI